jgi:TM2 domain-containing membrane protein YozV
MQLAAGMSAAQREIFYAELQHKAKDHTIALLLALLLGWNFGAHKFYLNRPITGLLYLVFALTGIPIILTIIDLFKLHDTVDLENQRIATEIAARVLAHVTV